MCKLVVTARAVRPLHVARVPLREIRLVRSTRNPLSSPALSLDRLRIEYGRRAIMISPDDKARFLEELQKRMPRPLTATIQP